MFALLVLINIQVRESLTKVVLVPFKGVLSHYTAPCKGAPLPAY